MGDSITTVVAGAGIVGSSVAYYLSRAGVAVDVVDPNLNPSSTSRASLGILTHFNGGDDPFSQFYRDSHQLHGELAEQLRDETGVDVGFRCLGGIDVSLSQEDSEALRQLEEFNRRRGCRCERLDRAALCELEPALAPAAMAGLLFPDDHRVDPERLGRALLTAARAAGARAAFGTAVQRIDSSSSEGIEITVTSSEGERSFAADYAVLTSGAWTTELTAAAGRELPVRPVRGQQGRYRRQQPVSHILRYDGNYLLPDGDEIIAGSTVEDVGFDLETTDAAATMFNGLCVDLLGRPLDLIELRAGLRPKGRRGRASIGPLGAGTRVFVAAGHYRNGVLMGPLTGKVIARWICEGTPGRDMSPFAPLD